MYVSSGCLNEEAHGVEDLGETFSFHQVLFHDVSQWVDGFAGDLVYGFSRSYVEDEGLIVEGNIFLFPFLKYYDI